MQEAKSKEDDFNNNIILDIQSEFIHFNNSLRALGALLKSSNLYDFADEDLANSINPEKNEESENLRWGLSQLINLCLDHQEKILSKYCDQYLESDFYLMEHSRVSINLIESGALRTQDDVKNSLNKTVVSLDTIINRGGILKLQAEKMKEICLKHMSALRVSKSAA